MPNPLEGVRVLDLTTVIGGPHGCFHLALMGAEVIKLEIPGVGDVARKLGADPSLNASNMGASFLQQNAGKKSITLDLKSESGQEIFRRLVATADVLVESFRPGVMARLGLDYERLTSIREDLIYCAISGFGQDSPLRDNPAYDQIVQGLSGAMSTTGTQDSGPLRAGYPVCDTIAGINAAYAVAAALFLRGRTGEGQFIDVSMLDSTFALMGWVTSNQLIAGQPPVLMGNDNFTASPSGSFRTAQGAINIACTNQKQFEELCRVLNREELIEDSRFVDREDRLTNRVALKSKIEEALAAKPASDWEGILNRGGVPAGLVLDLSEALAHPHVAHRGSVRRIEGVPGVPRAVDVFTSGYKLSGGAPNVSRPPPALGQHNAELLKSLGYSPSDIAGFQDAGVI